MTTNDIEYFFDTIPNVTLGVSCKNLDFQISNFPTTYATESTLSSVDTTLDENNGMLVGMEADLGGIYSNISTMYLNDVTRNQTLSSVDTKIGNVGGRLDTSNTHLSDIDTTLTDIYANTNTNKSLLTSIESSNTSINAKIKPLTATPTYFEFTNLAVNDSAVSRLVQNTTGSPVYITKIIIYVNRSGGNFDYNDWFDTRSVEHIIDISSSNDNYSTNSVRVLTEFQDMEELISRYDAERGWVGNEDAGALYGNVWWRISFENPVLCENNNYVRLYKNGNTTHITNERICVIGYY